MIVCTKTNSIELPPPENEFNDELANELNKQLHPKEMTDQRTWYKISNFAFLVVTNFASKLTRIFQRIDSPQKSKSSKICSSLLVNEITLTKLLVPLECALIRLCNIMESWTSSPVDSSAPYMLWPGVRCQSTTSIICFEEIFDLLREPKPSIVGSLIKILS